MLPISNEMSWTSEENNNRLEATVRAELSMYIFTCHARGISKLCVCMSQSNYMDIDGYRISQKEMF